jgi:hypothetical protein
MSLVGLSAAGDEAWVCPDCERRMLVTWAPQFRRTVLASGDESVQHTGSKGGATLASVGVTPTPTPATLAWLRTNGIAWDAETDDPPEAKSA